MPIRIVMMNGRHVIQANTLEELENYECPVTTNNVFQNIIHTQDPILNYRFDRTRILHHLPPMANEVQPPNHIFQHDPRLVGRCPLCRLDNVMDNITVNSAICLA